MEVTTGVLAFAQVGVGACGVIIKAIQLWEHVKQLPKELRTRVEKLKLLNQILCHIETDFAKHPGLRCRPTAQQCLEFARLAEKALCDHVEQLREKIDQPAKNKIRRRTSSFKIVTLKKEELATLEGELSSAMDLLQLSVSMFQLAKTELSEELIVRQTSARVREQSMACQDDVIRKTAQAVVKLMKTEQQSSANTTVFCNTGGPTKDVVVAGKPRRNGSSCFGSAMFGRFSFCQSKDDGKWSASIQTPWSRRVRELSWTGWQYQFRSYNIRPNNSPVFQAAEKGDVAELQKLFRTGQASPFDRNQAGFSLLYLAAREERLEVCEDLLRKGVPADDEREGYGHNPIDALVVSRQNFTGAPDANHESLITLFQSVALAADTLTTERLFTFVKEFSYSDDFLRVYQSQFLRNYDRLPIRDRAEAVRLGSFVVRDAMTYRRLLHPAAGTKAITPADVRGSAACGFSLVHSAAVALGKRLADEFQYDPKAFHARSYTERWSGLVVDTVAAASPEDLSGVETVVPWDWFRVPVWRATPLVSLMGGALCRLSPEVPLPKWDALVQRILRQWLEDLQTAGMDLLEYGRRESRIQRLLDPDVRGAFDHDAIKASRSVVRHELQESSKESWMKGVERDFGHVSDLYWTPIRIVSLDYGPHIDDWRVCWVVEVEAFAGEYWKMTETPRVAMPGSWVD